MTIPFLPRLLRISVVRANQIGIAISLIFFASTAARSQTFTPLQGSSGAEDLVNLLLPSRLTLVPGSATLTGDFNQDLITGDPIFTSPTSAAGKFEDFETIFGPDPVSGVLLTTGNGANSLPSPASSNAGATCNGVAPPNNTAPNCSPRITQQNDTVGNADLAGLLGIDLMNDSFNAVSLNFKAMLDPTLGSGAVYEIEYVFGSDEYNEFTTTPNNDVFGIFVNGSNIAFTMNNPSNIISVLSLNGSLMPDSFRNNDPFNTVSDGSPISPPDPDLVKFETEYDGLSIPLVASAVLLPNREYEFSFAIQDVLDASVDSGVFLTRARLTPLPVPGPLPLVGLAAAFGWSRQIRKRLRS